MQHSITAFPSHIILLLECVPSSTDSPTKKVVSNVYVLAGPTPYPRTKNNNHARTLLLLSLLWLMGDVE